MSCLLFLIWIICVYFSFVNLVRYLSHLIDIFKQSSFSFCFLHWLCCQFRWLILYFLLSPVFCLIWGYFVLLFMVSYVEGLIIDFGFSFSLVHAFYGICLPLSTLVPESHKFWEVLFSSIFGLNYFLISSLSRVLPRGVMLNLQVLRAFSGSLSVTYF